MFFGKNKLKIYYRKTAEVTSPEINSKGDWIDLYTPTYHGVPYKSNELRKLNLGIAMKLPKGMEAILAFRSSTGPDYHIIMPNGIGVIDSSFCGDSDVWKLPFYTLKDGVITGGSRLCQFRIQLSQKATILQKLRWLFASGIELVEVEHLDDINRGGFGTTGK